MLLALVLPLLATDYPGMVSIPAGEFTMGRTKLTSDDKTNMRPEILLDDRPEHKVGLDAFLIDAREVTNGQYAEFVKATRHRAPYHWSRGSIPKDEEQFPVFNVNWDDADAYCRWAAKRLPTEAEWERSARGGQEGLSYPWGDKPDPRAGNYDQRQPGPAGTYPPNSFGLYDMAGGVSEWCSDWFDRTYYRNSPPRNPRGPDTGLYKVIRGGAWSDSAARVTVFFRNWVRPNQASPNIGFRCARNSE